MTSGETTRPSRTSRSHVRVAVATLVLAASMVVVGPVAHPEPANAGTAEYMEGLIVRWINAAREQRGVRPLTVGPLLTDLAGDRAAEMASKGRLFHPSCLSCWLRSQSVSFSRCAEVIGWTSYPWGYDAARRIFLGWKNSSTHWGLLMSRSYTRIGIGVAYRSRDRTTYGAGLLAG